MDYIFGQVSAQFYLIRLSCVAQWDDEQLQHCDSVPGEERAGAVIPANFFTKTFILDPSFWVLFTLE